jgi:hypothetical protein
MVSMTMAEDNIVLENDHVVVRRIQSSRPGRVSSGKARRHRLIIYLRDAHVRRTEGGHQEELTRKAGDVVWRPGSEHEVEHIEDGEHEVLIVEFKD